MKINVLGQDVAIAAMKGIAVPPVSAETQSLVLTDTLPNF